MTARGQRAAALVIGAGLALLFSAIAAVQVAGWTIGAVERSHTQVIPGPVDRLVVDADGGEITIVPRGRRRADQLHRQGLDPHAGAARVPRRQHDPAQRQVPGDQLRPLPRADHDLRAREHAGRGALRLGRPDGERAHRPRRAGDRLRRRHRDGAHRPGGAADRLGRRQRARPQRRTQLHTGSGDVTAEGLAPPNVSADTSSGDVKLDFRLAPQDVVASTASGDVDITVPRGGAYHVEADPGSGDQQVDVKTDPDATSSIRANTSSGDVNVNYRN